MNQSTTPASSEVPDILDIYVPEPPLNYWMVAMWIAIALVAAAGIAWALVYFIRKDQSRRGQGAGPRRIALAQLARLEEEANGMSPNEFALRLSEIVKDYLHARYGDRFRFETAEEFLARAGDVRGSSMPASTAQSLADFIGHCEELKFGRPGDAAERCGPLLDVSRRIFHGQTASAGPSAVNAPTDDHATASSAAG